jgi:NAD(P)-dependent dehydrogenase (short-subunit alcohol dehydrogenase family)
MTERTGPAGGRIVVGSRELRPVCSRLSGRVALVSGAARGIGRAVAEWFLAEGASLLLVDLPGDWIERPSASDPSDRRVRFAADVADEVQARASVACAVERFGRLDILVNNAGIVEVRPFLESDAALYDRLMRVNVRGSFLLALEAARQMAAQGEGTIVQIASTCAFPAGASANLSVYNMSKAAVRQLTVTLAGELAPHNIRVNAVAPGTIDTAMTRTCLADVELADAVRRRIPLRRFGHPDDIAAACAFLCSDDARYITGHTLVVDGGWLVRTA